MAILLSSPQKVPVLTLYPQDPTAQVVVECPQVSAPAQLEPTAGQKLQLLKHQPLAPDWREIDSFIPMSPYPVEGTLWLSNPTHPYAYSII